MANTFKVITKAGVTSADVIYTVASSTTAIVLGFQIGMRPLFFLGILLLIVGIQSFFFGLIGEMIARKNNINVKYSIKKFY